MFKGAGAAAGTGAGGGGFDLDYGAVSEAGAFAEGWGCCEGREKLVEAMGQRGESLGGRELLVAGDIHAAATKEAHAPRSKRRKLKRFILSTGSDGLWPTCPTGKGTWSLVYGGASKVGRMFQDLEDIELKV